MVFDAVRGYLQLATGLTEVTKQRATDIAKALLSGSAADQAARGQAAVAQISALADEIVATSKANRELVLGLVRAEVDRAIGSLGLATQDDVAALRRRVDRLAAHEVGQRPPRKAAKKPARKSASKATKRPATKPSKEPIKKRAKEAPGD